MKRIKLIVLVMIMFFIGTNNIFALNIKQESLTVSDKSSTIKVIDEGIGNLKVTPKLQLNQVGDYITYKLVLKNTDGEKYKIESITDNNANDCINLDYKYSRGLDTNNKEILVTFKYVKKATAETSNLKDVKITIKIIDEDDNTQDVSVNGNPKTGISSEVYIWIVVIVVVISILTILLLLNKKKKSGKLLGLLLLLTLIPSIVMAATTASVLFDFRVENIDIHITHKITFDSNGGSKVDTQTIEDNAKVQKPDDPTRNHYIFDKWVDENGNEYDFDTEVTKDMTLKATWEKEEYTVTYDSDEGSSVDSETVKYEEKFKKPSNPEKEGHNFVKWVDENGNEYDFNSKAERNITLKAIWEKKTYTITFNTDGGTEIEKQKVKYKEKVERPSDPKKDYYDFVNWYTDDTYSTTYDFDTEVTSSFTIYAKYTPTVYRITYNLNDGTVTEANPTTYTIETDTFTLNNPTKENAVFKGWIGSNGDTPEKTVKVEKGTFGDLTYEAVFNPKYTVSYNTDGGNIIPPVMIEKGEKIGHLPTPVKEGYDFEGWYVGETKINNNYIVNDNVEVKAKWTIIEYTITYDLAHGSIEGENPDTYTIETDTFTLKNPTKTGYTFDGWTGSNGDEPQKNVIIEKGTIGDKTYKAHFTINKYTVTYDSDGGASVPSETKNYNETFTDPENPKKTGYKFIKWVDESGNDYDFATKVTKDITLKAVWEIVEYTITYDLDDGELEGENPTTYTIETETFTLKNPTKTGYTFDGWTGSNGDTPQKNVTIEKGSHGNKNYTANFTINKYTVTYDSDGGASVPSETKKYQETFTKPADPEKTGYKLTKWVDESGNDYDFATKVTRDITLKAVWEIVEYTITYDLDDGELEGENPTTYTIETETFTLKNPAKEGYVFKGWIIDDEDDPVLTMTVEKGSHGNIAFEAIFNELHTITFDTKGGSPIAPVQVEYGEKLSRPADPTREGYNFVKWLDHHGNTNDFDQPVLHSTTLTAVWDPIEYTITYDLDEGEVEGTNPTKYTIETEDIVLKNPTKEGYSFIGWTGSNGDAPQKNVTIAKGSTENKNYTANFTINEYTVTYDSDGGTSVPSETKKYQETFTEPSDPTRNHYVFKKWVDEDGNDYDFATKATRDITLKAIWEKEKYTVTYNSDGGTSVPSETKKYQETFTKPADPKKTGYTFKKWVDENGNDYDFATEATRNITLKAVWEIIEYTITYNLDEGELEGTNPETYTIETETFTLKNPTKEGHVFKGWIIDDEDDPVLTMTVEKGSHGNIAFEAIFNELHTITFDTKGGSLIAPVQVEYGEKLSRPADPTRKGYNFAKWLDHHGNTNDFDQPVLHSTTLTAVWDPIEYTISYDLDEGEVEGTNPTKYTIETEDIVLKNPTKEGYSFIGWTGSNGDTPQKNVTITKGSTENKNYTANWKKIHTVTFNTDEGTTITPAEVIDGELVSKPSDPTKELYDFDKWLDANGDEYNFSTPVKGDITLTAKWRAARATIAATESGSDNTLNKKMKKIANPEESISSGYNFNDTVTKSFKRATEEEYNAIKGSLTNDNIVSTSDSLSPVYMWFDSATGTMYWYTEATKVAFEGSMGRLFAKYTALEDLSGLADFDTSKVTDMNRMFQNCTALEDTINSSGEVTKAALAPIANWDVSSVKSFQFAFGGAKDGDAPKISDFSPISGWNVGNVENFNAMFKFNHYLTDLDDFEGWNMTSALNISNMFTGTSALTDASAIKEWNVVNVTNFNNVFSTGKDSGSPYASSGILAHYDNPEKLPPFDKRPGAWTSAGKYNPTS